MHFSLSDLLSILEQYKYLVIFPIAIIEGPIIIIISGFLVYLGVLNGVVAYVLLVVADVIGDVMYYSIGKYWRNSKWVNKSLAVLGYSNKSEVFLEKHFEKHKGKTFLIAKISHGIGGSVQVASGIAKVKLSDFLIYSFIGTIPKVILLLFTGYFMGSYYVKIDGYLHYAALVTIGAFVAILILYYFLAKYVRRFFNLNKEEVVDK